MRALAAFAVLVLVSAAVVPCTKGDENATNCVKCNGAEEDNDESEERVIFSDYLVFDLVGLVVWFVGSGLAISAGVGGGGIFMPLGALLLQFDPKTATALSQSSIFGASLAGLLLNSRARHPIADRPLIDIDMVLFLAPMEMAGAVLGYLILSICPLWLVFLLMVVVLGLTGIRTCLKGREMWAKQKKLREAQKKEHSEECAEAADRTIDSEVKMEQQRTTSSATGSTHVAGANDDSADLEGVEPDTQSVPATAQKKNMHSIDTWLTKDAARPTKKIIYLGVLWAILLLMILLKGGKGKAASVVPSWTYCGTEYWILTAFSFAWLLGFALLMGQRAVGKTLRKQAVGYSFVDGDVQWNWRRFGGYSAATFVAGVIAGMIGIGGGMVLGPLMLQLGVLPQVSSASTATMIALTSSSLAATAVIQGKVPWSYALTFFITAFFGALIGKYKIDAFVKKKQLTALLVFLLAGVICFAAITMFGYGLYTYSEKGWHFICPEDELKSLCPANKTVLN